MKFLTDYSKKASLDYEKSTLHDSQALTDEQTQKLISIVLNFTKNYQKTKSNKVYRKSQIKKETEESISKTSSEDSLSSEQETESQKTESSKEKQAKSIFIIKKVKKRNTIEKCEDVYYDSSTFKNVPCSTSHGSNAFYSHNQSDLAISNNLVSNVLNSRKSKKISNCLINSKLAYPVINKNSSSKFSNFPNLPNLSKITTTLGANPNYNNLSQIPLQVKSYHNNSNNYEQNLNFLINEENYMEIMKDEVRKHSNSKEFSYSTQDSPLLKEFDGIYRNPYNNFGHYATNQNSNNSHFNYASGPCLLNDPNKHPENSPKNLYEELRSFFNNKRKISEHKSTTRDDSRLNSRRESHMLNFAQKEEIFSDKNFISKPSKFVLI